MRSCAQANGAPRLPAPRVARACEPARSTHATLPAERISPVAAPKARLKLSWPAAPWPARFHALGLREQGRAPLRITFMRSTQLSRALGANGFRDRTFPPRNLPVHARRRSATASRLHVSPSPRPQRRRRAPRAPARAGRRALLARRGCAAPCAATPTQAPALLVGARLAPPRANLAGIAHISWPALCRERSKLHRESHQRHDRRTARVACGAPLRRHLVHWRCTFPPRRAARARLRLARCRSAHLRRPTARATSPAKVRSAARRNRPPAAPPMCSRTAARRPPAPHRAAVRLHIGSAALRAGGAAPAATASPHHVFPN